MTLTYEDADVGDLIESDRGRFEIVGKRDFIVIVDEINRFKSEILDEPHFNMMSFKKIRVCAPCTYRRSNGPRLKY